MRLTVDDAVDESEVEGDELDDRLLREEHERAEEGTDDKVRVEAVTIVSTAKSDGRYVCSPCWLPRLLERGPYLPHRPLLGIQLLADLIRLSPEQDWGVCCTD